MPSVTYGLGGFDPSKPNNNIIEIIEDDPIPPPPPFASPASIRVALRRLHGITLPQLNAVISQVISSMPDPGDREDAEILWEYSVQIERYHPLVGAIAMALNLTDEQVDDVFRATANV